jgi:putative restriction endonuclease
MKFWIGITDNDWYKFLAGIEPEEVNFWQPSARNFRILNQGDLFLFKLHSPYNYIVGGGFFLSYTRLPLSLAWDTFQESNGARTYSEFRGLIFKRKRLDPKNLIDPEVGCIILSNPFFFDKQQWIRIPTDFSLNIQTGKTYNSVSETGGKIWDQVLARLSSIRLYDALDKNITIVAEEAARYGAEYVNRVRIGQRSFRALVTDAYQRRCSISGEKTLPALDAAHIKPFSESGPNYTRNGLLIRSDIHKLFDKGYVTITPDYNIKISKRIKEEYENGREYYAYHGKRLITLPNNTNDRPSKEFLEWHNNNRYFG